ncbi:hypothetical protein MSIMFB_01075 [Mycobacterium simulans]|uniref:Uncharacterized protein n=1 Tax=Mycobacterium simulans TaxID=627089 RepID=A0A7Z7IIZ8_9MYCO|nr:hypothetical protein [Mycobacterium simulans]SOJ53574.1 hypothetical protein MSIMFB_01075 [Mycobacterium simulans]
MEIERLSPPYEIELHRDGGKLVQVVIRAVGGDGNLSYEELREATRSILDRVRHEHISAMQRRTTASPPRSVKAMVLEYNDGNHGVTARYLASLSVAYEDLAPQGRAVSTKLAGALGIPVTTLKGHLVRAREDGYLTKAVQGREGGEATEKAHEVLNRG